MLSETSLKTIINLENFEENVNRAVLDFQTLKKANKEINFSLPLVSSYV